MRPCFFRCDFLFLVCHSQNTHTHTVPHHLANIMTIGDNPSVQRIVTCTAPVNIAVIKYWGKRDESLILPTNSSLSATLDQSDLKTTTTMVAINDENRKSPSENSEIEVEIWLNGRRESLENDRVQNVLSEMKQRYMVARESAPEEQKKHLLPRIPDKIIVVSENDFPTAAGLASSASGYCCLVYTMAHLFGLVHEDNMDSVEMRSDLSIAARKGSGSACRSLFGGWTKWDMGKREDGSDSLALPVAPRDHWQQEEAEQEDVEDAEVKIMICVVNDQKKHISSTVGMRNSVQTSKLMKERIESIVPKRMVEMEKAILDRDFHSFAEICATDSDDFHAVCRDTTPPIHYLSDASFFIIDLVRFYNAHLTEDGRNVASYTFDAGPNAVVFVRGRKHYDALKSILLHHFEITGDSRPATAIIQSGESESDVQPLLDKIRSHKDMIEKYEQLKGKGSNKLKYIIETRVGDGPRLFTDTDAHLIDISTLQPKRVSM